MKAVPFTRVAGVKPVHQFLKNIGAPADRIAQKVGLSTAKFNCPDAFVPFFPARRFFGAAARAAGAENLGAVVGLSAPIWDLGAYGSALRRSATLYDVMLSAVRLVRRFSSAYRLWIREDGDRLWFCERFVGGADDGSDQVDAYAIAGVIKGVGDVVGPDWRPAHLRVPARARAAIRGIDAWSDARIEFTRDVSAVAIPRRFLTIALPAARERRPDNTDAGSQISAPPSDFINSVTLVIQHTIADGPMSLKRVGEAVGTSARSLQRQLADAGLTFSELVARSRLSLARELLLDPAVKIIDVAVELGYSDPANFTRAFSRWTGVPPREYRDSLLGN